MITLTVIICGCLLLAGTVAVLVTASSAPLGYENEQGFFAGIEPRPQEFSETCAAQRLGAAERALEESVGSYEDVEPWPQEGLRAVEPILSAHRASSHVHGVQ